MYVVVSHEKVREEETQKQEDRKIVRKEKRAAISEGELDPLITKVNVLFNSESDDDEEDDLNEEDEYANTENDSEPADDFILMEAARIVKDLIDLKQERLMADTPQETSAKLGKKL